MNRRLYRSRRDSVLGGVAGGVADYFDIDPSIVRVVWAVLALVTGGIFLVLYIVMWIVVPEGPSAATVAARRRAAAASSPADRRRRAAAAPPPDWEAHEQRLRRGGSGGAVIFGADPDRARGLVPDRPVPARLRPRPALAGSARGPGRRPARRRPATAARPSSSRPNRANAAALTATSMPAASFTSRPRSAGSRSPCGGCGNWKA